MKNNISKYRDTSVCYCTAPFSFNILNILYSVTANNIYNNIQLMVTMNACIFDEFFLQSPINVDIYYTIIVNECFDKLFKNVIQVCRVTEHKHLHISVYYYVISILVNVNNVRNLIYMI